MRKVFSVFLFLLGGCILLSGTAFSQDEMLRPLPLATASVLQAVTTKGTHQADLQRAGYSLEERDGSLRAEGRRRRSYTFLGSSGSSAVLVDDEYPRLVSISRELVFDMKFSVKEGRSPADMPGITPGLVAAAQKAVSEDPAVVAGIGYLATASGTGVSPEALQTAVIDYVRAYRQPSTPIHEVCAGCGSQDGFGDEYIGGPDMHTPLEVEGSGWKIAGIRHYLNGDGVFTVQVTAKIPRS